MFFFMAIGLNFLKKNRKSLKKKKNHHRCRIFSMDEYTSMKSAAEVILFSLSLLSHSICTSLILRMSDYCRGRNCAVWILWILLNVCLRSKEAGQWILFFFVRFVIFHMCSWLYILWSLIRVKISVEGYDTSIPAVDIANALTSHFGSCGRICNLVIPRDPVTNAVDRFVEYQ